MHPSTLAWARYEDLSSDAEAATVSRFCLFSFATLEVTASPTTTNIAMIEQEHPHSWRWLVVNADGFVIDCGTEPSKTYAKSAVEMALRAELKPVASSGPGEGGEDFPR